ncbi:MAG: hypothetical protein J1F64_06740 [Oscillospiraceae bacterium]|nr:hypothetical protein [Oscillospiraceae bacterium]
MADFKCYIAKKDGTTVLFREYFSDESEYVKWRKKTEENALEEYYNKKIELVIDELTIDDPLNF